MDIGTSIIKYVLFAFNFVLVMIGLCLVVFGGLVINGNDDVSKVLENNDFTTIGVFLIFIGLCIFVVSFFGCWGALFENYSMLETYGVFLSVFFLLQLILYGIMYLYDKHLSQQVAKVALYTVFDNYEKQDYRTIVDSIQESNECCGVEGKEFWKNEFPSSCCSKNFEKCDNYNAYRKGCLNDFKDAIASKFHLLWITYFLCIQILNIGPTFYLAKYFKMRRSYYYTI